jgi:hypothetical protein
MYSKLENLQVPCLQMIIVGHKAEATEEDELVGLNSGLKFLLRLGLGVNVNVDMIVRLELGRHGEAKNMKNCKFLLFLSFGRAI